MTREQVASSSVDSKSIEDFEFAMRRTAEALARKKSVEEVASTDNVTESEMDESRYRRRTGYYAFGVKFGYLFPMGGYEKYSYDYDYYGSSYDTTQYAQVLTTDFVNWFELPKDLALEWDLHVGWGVELGTHFFLLKIMSRGDFAPYFGGGVGVDYVFPEEYEEQENKRNSGFALNGKAGVLLFRTYDFRVTADAGYKVIFNDDMDRGPTANVGITWKKSSGRSGNPVVTGLAITGGVVVTVLVVGLVS